MINYIWIIKDSGENLFYKNFGKSPIQLDENLISGLFVALNNFAKESGKGAIDSLILKDAKFIYMNFGPIFVVIGCDRSDEIDTMRDIMSQIGTRFLKEYKDLENWDGNVKMFRPFSDILDTEFKFEPSTTIQAPQLSREELIIQEFKDVVAEFPCDMIKNTASNINVFLSRSLEEHFIVNINFKNYPEKPKISFPKDLKKILGKPDDALLTIANWNSEFPPKIIEVLRELESYIIQSRQEVNYSPTIILDKE